MPVRLIFSLPTAPIRASSRGGKQALYKIDKKYSSELRTGGRRITSRTANPYGVLHSLQALIVHFFLALELSQLVQLFEHFFGILWYFQLRPIDVPVRHPL